MQRTESGAPKRRDAARCAGAHEAASCGPQSAEVHGLERVRGRDQHEADPVPSETSGLGPVLSQVLAGTAVMTISVGVTAMQTRTTPRA